MRHTIDTIKAIVAKLKRQPALASELSDGANLIDQIGLDSLEMLQFMLEVEERLDIQINFDLLEFAHLRAIHVFAAFLEGMPRRRSASEPV